jgi:hypothetical protein
MAGAAIPSNKSPTKTSPDFFILGSPPLVILNECKGLLQLILPLSPPFRLMG